MKAVILAAGMGTRLGPLTADMPKCLVDIGGKPLLEYSLGNLASCGIGETVIVTGYLENRIRDRIGNAFKGMAVRYARNGRYSETGSMYSLSCAKSIVDDDILLLESDLLYEKRAVSRLLESEWADAILTGDLLGNGDDVYICAGEDGRIANLGKKIPPEQVKTAKGCLVGISKLSRAFLIKLFDKAEKNYASGRVNDHYEECILETSLESAAPVYVSYCGGLAWTEIDTADDLKLAREVIYPGIYAKEETCNL